MEISPAFLEFKPPFTKSLTETITLYNPTLEVLAFKVKTTAPKLYCVRPNALTVQPGEKLKVQIILQGLKQEPEPSYKCHDKFLVVSLPCPGKRDDTESIAELWPSLESKYKDQSTSKKIRVIFKTQAVPVAAAPAAAAAVPEAKETPIKKPSSLSVDDTVNDSVYSSSESPVKKDRDLAESQKKINQLDAKLSSNAAETKVEEAKAGIPTPTVVLGAILALLLAWLFF